MWQVCATSFSLFFKTQYPGPFIMTHQASCWTNCTFRHSLVTVASHTSTSWSVTFLANQSNWDCTSSTDATHQLCCRLWRLIFLPTMLICWSSFSNRHLYWFLDSDSVLASQWHECLICGLGSEHVFCYRLSLVLVWLI